MSGPGRAADRLLDGAQTVVDGAADLVDRVVWIAECALRRGPCRQAAGVVLAVLGTCAVLAGLVLVSIRPTSAQANGADPLRVSVRLTDRTQGAALTPQTPLELSSTAVPAAGVPVITVRDTQRNQTISGFGAALTDSSAQLIEHDLPAPVRTQLMDALFAPAGLGLSSLRVPVGASDYTAAGKPYTYDDSAPDPKLTHFSIARDGAAVLPLLRQARSLNPKLSLVATPWSAPAWMKANDAYDDLHGLGTLKPADLTVYANYLVRFLQAYAQAGAPVSALTPANEPGNQTSYPGMNLPAATEARFVAGDLLPALTRAKQKVAVYGADIGWASTGYARQLATAPGGASLAGLAWHCYYGGPEVMAALHYEHPKLAQILSECSPGISTEPIAEIVIAALRNWANGVDLWNLALDPKGGPVQQPNTGCAGCSGLITVNPSTHSYTPNTPYYQLGQASEAIEPGAVRIGSNSFVGYDYRKPNTPWASAGVDNVAAQNPDGSISLLAYNTAPTTQTFAVRWHSYYLTYTLDPGATVSLRWRMPAGSGD